MPKEHSVVLNYAGEVFSPTPRTVKVAPGDTLVFALGAGPDDGKIRITIANGQHFSPSKVQHGPSQKGKDGLRVGVAGGFNAKTTYKCELLDKSGNVVLNSDGTPAMADGASGGEIEPVGGL